MDRTMQNKIVAATQFKAQCLRVIDQMNRDHEPVTITKRGRPVAMLTPIAASGSRPIVGALRGSVLRYDDPFSPVGEPGDWNAGE